MEVEMRRALGHYGRLLKDGDNAGSRKSRQKRTAAVSTGDAPQRKKKFSRTESQKKSQPTVLRTSGSTSSLPFPRVSSTPRPVEVVRFTDPGQQQPHHATPVENRKAFLSSKVSDLYQENADDSSDDAEDFGSRRRRRQKKQGGSDDFDFDNACNDIRQLVNKSGGTGDVAKRYGFATSSKPVKMPYNMLMRVNKYRRDQEKETAELMRLSQIGTTNKRKKDKKRQQPANFSGRGRWKEVARPLNPSIGHFRKGVQQLKPSDIQRVQRKSKRR